MVQRLPLTQARNALGAVVKRVHLTDDGILIRPAVAVPVEIYTPARVAEFLLSNAVDTTAYGKAVRALRELGIDPRAVAHHRPRRP